MAARRKPRKITSVSMDLDAWTSLEEACAQLRLPKTAVLSCLCRFLWAQDHEGQQLIAGVLPAGRAVEAAAGIAAVAAMWTPPPRTGVHRAKPVQRPHRNAQGSGRYRAS